MLLDVCLTSRSLRHLPEEFFSVDCLLWQKLYYISKFRQKHSISKLNQFELRLVNKVGKLTQNKSSASDEQASILVNNNTTPLDNQPSASKIEGNKLSSSSLSDLSETLSDISDSAILETVIVEKANGTKTSKKKQKSFGAEVSSKASRKSDRQCKLSRKRQAKRLMPSRSMCCSKKCGALAFVATYISLDTLFNLFFVTFSAKITKSFVLTPNITKSFNKVRCLAVCLRAR